ncbi:hypothetical protein Esi_0192_0044 [Ectocarpus siliculosus]|uniref:Uncharacterized protein n=1 Tax=Ectocarpus siliculosus TaxID=2880 RepID=D8LHI1_ECTSI|nr:hypothetical protein Esi_0192_0044 [Ectocarpus siliculosus]|eukprot:CBN79132.1 hypothetical protein Esi_0192_0044 [Ectocarpus siliculosus]
MLARQAEDELAATVSWGDQMKKANEAPTKKTTRQNFRINALNTSVKQLRQSLAVVESTRKPFDPAELQQIVEEGVKDNLRPRQVPEESEQESKEKGEPGAETKEGEQKNKLGRRKYGLASARLVEKMIQAGTPLVQVAPLIIGTVKTAYGIELDGKTKFTGTTAKRHVRSVFYISIKLSSSESFWQLRTF